ncbi:MAG: hypothetical protein ACM3TR_04320, partial [Caulobacteraceae bacterium]
MRVLLALNHEEIEEFISYLPGIEILAIIKDKHSLLEFFKTNGCDLVILENELPGSESMEEVIALLVSDKSRIQRIVYLYGEYDENCDAFIQFLRENGINDCFIGTEITSRDIERLIYNPAGMKNLYEGNEDGHRLPFLRFKSSSYKKESRKVVKAQGKSVISIISNNATGKSHTAWNLGYCFSKRGYDTSIFNIDRGYSANLYWHIDEIYYELLNYAIAKNKHKKILEDCFRIKNLNVITGKLGDQNEIKTDDFAKLLYNIRTQSDITLIDTKTGLSENTKHAIKNSTYDLLVFDCDIMHYHMNMVMVENLRDEFVPEKTIAIINNTNIKSSSHKFIYNEIKSTGLPFKDILPISSCGLIS